MRLKPLLITACLIGTALTLLPSVIAKQLPAEEIAEEAALREQKAGVDGGQASAMDEEVGPSGEDQEEEPVDEKDVVVLTQDNFLSTINKQQYALVRSRRRAYHASAPRSPTAPQYQSPSRDVTCA